MARDDHEARRKFLKGAGLASAAALLGAVPLVHAEAESREAVMAEHWGAKQKEYEALEEQARAEYKPFDSPPEYVYRGTDSTDSTPTFYAPLQEECKYLPEFQSIFSAGTAGQYFRHTLKFGMKDIIRFHGHSCEALYYTAAICRLIFDKLFPNGVVDRTVLRAVGGESPCITDALTYITGGRMHFGGIAVDFSLGHAVVVQRIDNQETWMGAWKNGIQSWNDTTVFAKPNPANPIPHKRWSNWRFEPNTPPEQLDQCRIRWKYPQPELLQRLKDLKDNLKFLPKGQKPTVDPNKVREEFEWLQYRHLREIFSHPIAESFQIKRVHNYRWEFPHCEPLWIPRFDQQSKWAPFEARPAKMHR